MSCCKGCASGQGCIDGGSLGACVGVRPGRLTNACYDWPGSFRCWGGSCALPRWGGAAAITSPYTPGRVRARRGQVIAQAANGQMVMVPAATAAAHKGLSFSLGLAGPQLNLEGTIEELAAWARENAKPILVGAALAWWLSRRRR